jgi:hypothetical protein
MDIDRIKDAVRQIEAGVDQIRSTGVSYTLDVLFAAHRLVIERFAPFKVGDRVALSKTPKIDRETAWGWLGSKHFLVQGALGIVRTVDLHGDGKLSFGVEFDDETWIDRDGHRRPLDRKHHYCFGEGSLCLAAPSDTPTDAAELSEQPIRTQAKASVRDEQCAWWDETETATGVQTQGERK